MPTQTLVISKEDFAKSQGVSLPENGILRITVYQNGQYPKTIEITDDTVPVGVIASMGPYKTVNCYEFPGDFRFIVPADMVKNGTMLSGREKIETVLKKLFPDRYYLTSLNGLYIHYPTITVRNSIGQQHTITDLIIYLEYTNGGGVQGLQGMRMSFTAKELEKRFAHPHMDSSIHRFQTFCLGSTSRFKSFLHQCRQVNTISGLELFFNQLQAFLEWESIEGKPYQSLSNLYTAGVSGQYNAPDFCPDPFDWDAADVVGYIFMNIDSSLLVRKANNVVLFSPALNPEKYFQIEQEAIELYSDSLPDEYYHSFDLISNQYVTGGSVFDETHDYSGLLPHYHDYSTVFDAFNQKPRILATETKDIERKIVQRLAVNVRHWVVLYINFLLLNHKKPLKNDETRQEDSGGSQQGAVTPDILVA